MRVLCGCWLGVATACLAVVAHDDRRRAEDEKPTPLVNTPLTNHLLRQNEDWRRDWWRLRGECVGLETKLVKVTDELLATRELLADTERRAGVGAGAGGKVIRPGDAPADLIPPQDLPVPAP